MNVEVRGNKFYVVKAGIDIACFISLYKLSEFLQIVEDYGTNF